LDFTVDLPENNTLNSLVVRNSGTAKSGLEISGLSLWQDGGNVGFDGFAVDELLASGTYDQDSGNWAFTDISQVVSSGENRFFVSAETLKNGTVNRSFVFYLPGFSDQNNDGLYDSGDRGMFFETNLSLPSADLQIVGSSKYNTVAGDPWAPVAAITNLVDGQTLDVETFTITGEAKDQGGSFSADTQICIDAVCEAVTNTGSYNSTWTYDWGGLETGAYEVYVKSTDFNDNTFTSDTITVNVDLEVAVVEPEEVTPSEAVFSMENSTVIQDKDFAVANGVDYIKFDVTVNDSNNEPVKNTIVYFNEIREDDGPVILKSKVTDADGMVDYKMRSTKAGDQLVSITTEDGDTVKEQFTVNYSEVTLDIDYTSGKWVKLAEKTAVYHLDSNNIRHAYPTQSIWESYWEEDFSFVETIDVDEMASYALGRNVPFKSGGLIKIPSVPKVYYVSQNASIHWVADEATAKSLYGANWASTVKDLPESFFLDYSVGGGIE